MCVCVSVCMCVLFYFLLSFHLGLTQRTSLYLFNRTYLYPVDMDFYMPFDWHAFSFSLACFAQLYTNMLVIQTLIGDFG